MSEQAPTEIPEPRYPKLTPANGNLDATQLTQYEYLDNKTTQVYRDKITTTDVDGSLQGPFNVLLYTPTLVEPWVNLHLSIAGLLPSIEAEAAVLGVLSIIKTPYALYAHRVLAKRAGFTQQQVKDMLAGTCPDDVRVREKAIYGLAREVVVLRGPLEESIWKEMVNVLGREDIMAVVNQIGAFVHASMMMNVGGVGLPMGVRGE